MPLSNLRYWFWLVIFFYEGHIYLQLKLLLVVCVVALLLLNVMVTL